MSESTFMMIVKAVFDWLNIVIHGMDEMVLLRFENGMDLSVWDLSIGTFIAGVIISVMAIMFYQDANKGESTGETGTNSGRKRPRAKVR